MEQPKNMQGLEKLVGFLEEQRKGAIRSSQNEFLAAAASGVLSEITLYGAVTNNVGISPYFSIGVSAVLGVTSLFYIAISALNFYRSDLLGDRIAELKQLQGYKAPESSGQR